MIRQDTATWRTDVKFLEKFREFRKGNERGKAKNGQGEPVAKLDGTDRFSRG